MSTEDEKPKWVLIEDGLSLTEEEWTPEAVTEEIADRLGIPYSDIQGVSTMKNDPPAGSEFYVTLTIKAEKDVE